MTESHWRLKHDGTKDGGKMVGGCELQRAHAETRFNGAAAERAEVRVDREPREVIGVHDDTSW